MATSSAWQGPVTHYNKEYHISHENVLPTIKLVSGTIPLIAEKIIFLLRKQSVFLIRHPKKQKE
jgi:hypothetical protein